MKKFYTIIVKLQIPVLILFALCAAVCFFMQAMVEVDYDITDYLPADSPSTVAKDVLEEEFEEDIPNMRVMIRDVGIPEALAFKEHLKAIPGVEEVAWLDDNADITVPVSVMDKDTLESYYKDSCALYTMTVRTDSCVETVGAIRELIGDENAMTGGAVFTAAATADTVTEVRYITIFAVLYVLIVLLLNTRSFAEPFIILTGLGTAIILNAGSNLIFGEISFVTNAAGNILLLAVSLDYSVFLTHRFEECRQHHSNDKEAMVEALCRSTTTILSSGLTTVIGFLALILMRFRLGPDLGLALAKGVLLSLITVFIFLPCLILLFCGLIDRTKHRLIIQGFHRLGALVSRVTVPLVCIFLLVIVPAFMASNDNEFYFGASHMYADDSQISLDTAAIQEVFGKSDTYVLLVPEGDTAAEARLSAELKELPQITGIVSYVDTVGASVPFSYLDPDTLSLLESEHYSRMILNAAVDSEGDDAFTLIENIRAAADRYYPGEYHLAGLGVSTYDLKDTVTSDMLKVNLIAIGAVLFVLMLLTRRLLLPFILVISIETAIWINLSLPYFLGDHIYYIAYLIISSVQLGATVDYAILFSDRYREFREIIGKKEAVEETVSSVFVSVMTSGSALAVVGFLMGIFCSNQLIAQLGKFLGVGAITSLTVVIFVLPGLLYLLDRTFIKNTDNTKEALPHEKTHETQKQ